MKRFLISQRMPLGWVRPAVLVATLLGTPVTALADPDCDPMRNVGRAVVGGILNGVLSGMNKIAGGVAGVENGISPTPSSALNDCIIPRLNPRPENRPPSGGPITSWPRPPAGSWGDPHFVTHDGLGFGFQAAGDYAYIDSGDLTVQARLFRTRPSSGVSRIKALAIRAGSTRVTINDPLDQTAGQQFGAVTVNGVDTPIGLGGWIDLDDAGSYVQQFSSGTYIKIAGKVDILYRLNGNAMALVLDESLRGNVTGLMGNFDGNPANDLQTSAGQVFTIDDADTLYGDYLAGWLRTGDASLFNTPFDPLSEGPIAPAQVASLSSVPLSQREAETQRCEQAGVSDGYWLHSCIYDLVFDGDISLVEDAAPLARLASVRVPAAALVAASGPAIALGANASVGPQQPTDQAGRLAVQDEVDVYSVSIAQSAPRILQMTSPCSSAAPFSVLVEDAGGETTNHPMACDTPINLPTGDVRLSVFSPGGDTGDYAFNLVEPQTTDLGTVALDTSISGTLAHLAGLTATLPSQNGDRVYIASDQDENCRREWTVVDSTGAVVRRNRLCGDLGLVSIDGNAPYRIRLQPDNTSPYAFTVYSAGQVSQTDTGGSRQFTLQVNTPGQTASAVIEATAGERLYVLRESGVSSGQLLVQDPDGIVIANTTLSQADVQFQAGVAGPYTILLQPSGDFTGTVPIEVIAVADNVQLQVSRGETFTLTISTLGQRATALFDMQAGETFSLTLASSEVVSGFRAIPRVYPPGDATPLPIISGARSFSAEQSGQYQLVVEPRETDNFIGSITFELR